jgi:signal transduction histidine kinase
MQNPAKNSDPSAIFSFSNKSPQASLGTINLRRSIVQVLDEFDHQLSIQAIRTSIDVSATIETEIDGSLFCQALRSLCHHAITSMPNGGELVITVYADAGGIEVEVADSRSGYISEEQQARLRSYRKTTGERDQDDIADACHFAEVHNGSVRVQNCPEGGVAFTIHLPSPKTLRSAA